MNDIEKNIIIELYKEFIDEEFSESCVLCSHGYVGKNKFYVCGLGNFHQCCGGANCKDFEMSSVVSALFRKIKELKSVSNVKWHKTKDELPELLDKYKNENAPEIPCICKRGWWYGVRYWNPSYHCWDDKAADDYCCDADKVEEWCYLDDLLQNRG